MTAHTPATAEIEKWILDPVRFLPNFWLRVRFWVRMKNAESIRNRLRQIVLQHCLCNIMATRVIDVQL